MKLTISRPWMLTALLLGGCVKHGEPAVLQNIIVNEQPSQDGDAQPVRLTFEFDRAPPCESLVSFGILINVDDDPATGVDDPELQSFGADARIVVSCQGNQFRSEIGEVTVEGTTIHLDTTMGQLPASAKSYIGFALRVRAVQRVPFKSAYTFTWTLGAAERR